MKINPTNSYNKIYDDSQKKKDVEKKDKSSTSSQKSDSLELSPEALKFAPIKEKIKQGFYENEDVLNKISEKLLNDLEN